MKKFLYPFLILAFVCISSCNNSGKKSTSSNQVVSKNKATIINDNIQGVFFDTPFGASKEDVIKNISNHGFVLNLRNSTDVLLHFLPAKGTLFSFGNMNWEMLDIGFTNEKFSYIRFMNARYDKGTAIHDYNSILSTVSTKYHMTEENPRDSTEFKLSVGYSNSNKIVWVTCFKYESNYFVSLDYDDDEFNKVSNEL